MGNAAINRPWWFRIFPWSAVVFTKSSHGDVEEEELGENSVFSVTQFLIDFAPIEHLISERLQCLMEDGDIDEQEFEIAKKRITGKIVFIGAADPDAALDRSFTVPGLSRIAYPGVYLHACAANTLTTRPIWELTSLGHIAIDIVLSITLIGTVTGLRLGSLARGSTSRIHRFIHSDYLPLSVSLVVAVVGFIIGVLLINLTHIMWVDFVLVLFALSIHTGLDIRIEKAWNWFS